MQEEFTNANVPVAVAAKVLKMDCQTVRLLLQNKIVDWGMCYRLPHSKHYSYIIYAKKFAECTGFVYRGERVSYE